MKKFLFGIATSIVFLCIGSMLIVFEMKEYRIVSAYTKLYDDVQTYETEVGENDTLRIDLDEDVIVTFDMNESMGDDVEIDVAENVEHTFKNNRLRVSDYRWYRFPFGKYIDIMMDGLKEQKIYYFDHDDRNNGSVTIRCSEKARKYIRIDD